MDMKSDQGPDPARQEKKQYCRGCGGVLPPGVRAHFHKECLRADKRSRISEDRAREHEKFQRWLKKLRCPNCGAGYSDQVSGGAIEALREASRPTQRRDTEVGCSSALVTDVQAGERG